MSEKGKYSNFRGSKLCLDEKRQADICAIVAMGCSLQTAADYVGVARRTLYRTTLKDPAFADALRNARSRGEITLLREVHDAAVKQRDWRAAVWLLAHCFRDRYYTRQPGIPGEQVRVLIERVTEALIGEVRDAADRERMTTRLGQISRELGGVVESGRQLGQET